jgi:CBS domain-containing protein
MNKERVGALIIMKDETLLGIFTERDLLNRVIVTKIDLATTPIHEVMTKDLVVVKSSLTVNRAMRVVTEKRLRHLPVVEDGKLLGMVSSGDLTRSLVAEGEEMIHSLMDYINGTYPG